MLGMEMAAVVNSVVKEISVAKVFQAAGARRYQITFAKSSAETIAAIISTPKICWGLRREKVVLAQRNIADMV